MKVICTTKDLFQGVQVAGRAVSARSSLPILGHLLIRSEGDKLRIAATDLEIGMECAVPASVQEEGSLTVPAKIFTEVLGALPEADVALSVDESNTTTVKCGTSEYTILGLPPEEFPMLPEVKEEASFSVGKSTLRNAIRKTRFAVSQDESRARLTGILTAITDSTIRLVSTDTYRLCVYDFTAVEAAGQTQVIIPGKAMAELERILGDEEGQVQAAISKTQVLFTVDDTLLVSRLIEGQFPDYDRVIPKEHNRKLTIPTEQLLTGVKRASIVARESANKIITRTSDDKLIITAESGGIGRAYEEVDVVREGEDIEIAFNAKFLGEFLDAVSDTGDEAIEMQIAGALNATLMKPSGGSGEESYTYVLMPVQL